MSGAALPECQYGGEITARIADSGIFGGYVFAFALMVSLCGMVVFVLLGLATWVSERF
ncbi:MAG: hypothetical protein ACPGFC_08090 [Paracoccaceae bacterium]